MTVSTKAIRHNHSPNTFVASDFLADWFKNLFETISNHSIIEYINCIAIHTRKYGENRVALGEKFTIVSGKKNETIYAGKIEEIQ